MHHLHPIKSYQTGKPYQAMQRTMQHRVMQRGVALITALVITAIAVSLAATLAYRQQVAIRLSGNLAALEQAYQYATGMETWAGVILRNDLQDNNIDTLDDDWATLIPPIPIPGGQMNGQLFDLHARLNLNDVLETVNENGRNEQRPEVLQAESLRTLFTKLKLPEPQQLIDNLVDWLDENEQESDNGVESSYYKTLEQPYLAANSRLVSPTEIRLIKGFNGKFANEEGVEESVLNKITPHVTTLPAKKIKINVNTASHIVLSTINNISDAQVSQALEAREVEPFSTVRDFVRTLELAESDVFPVDQLSVNSEYFLLQGKVEIGRVRVFINSVIHRDNAGRTRVISREFTQT